MNRRRLLCSLVWPVILRFANLIEIKIDEQTQWIKKSKESFDSFKYLEVESFVFSSKRICHFIIYRRLRWVLKTKNFQRAMEVILLLQESRALWFDVNHQTNRAWDSDGRKQQSSDHLLAFGFFSWQELVPLLALPDLLLQPLAAQVD